MNYKTLTTAYNRTDYEMRKVTDELEVPTSKAAQFTPAEPIDPDTVRSVMSSNEYAFIAPVTDDKDLSSKVLDAETNEFFHIKVLEASIHIYPKNNEFSFETLERVVECITEHITDLSLD